MYAGFARNILNEFQQQETANQQRKGWRGRGLTLPFPAVFPLKLSSQASFSSVEKGHEHPYFFSPVGRKSTCVASEGKNSKGENSLFPS